LFLQFVKSSEYFNVLQRVLQLNVFVS